MMPWSRIRVLLTFIFFLFFVANGAVTAQAQTAAEDSAFSVHANPTLHLTRRVGDIRIDGDLNDSGWKNAARTTEFVTCVPYRTATCKEPTDAMITYDDEYLYVGMIAHDHEPDAIRATMIARDNIWDDDFMGIILDTYGDATKAFELYVNPLGIQGDLFWTSTNEDGSYDLVYDAEARRTKDGWQMEMRIPFRSLRFPEKEIQNFHLTFWRNYPRDRVYKFSSSAINFSIPCTFCQLGILTGIENIHPTGSFELLPAVVASQSASMRDPNQPELPLDNDPVKFKPSLSLRYAIGPATGIEATINPDFSQVEVDASQVSANSTFALFYPEHRPFFQDGSDLLNTYLNAVYTRSINSPIAAAKVLHRDANTSIAYIGGIDQQTPIIIPLEERSIIIPDAGRSISNIVRATRTLADDTYLGVLATDRRYTDGDGANTVYGIDTRVRVFENVEFLGQQLFSYTHEQMRPDLGESQRFDRGRYTTTLDGERFSGNANYFALQRFTPGLDLYVDYKQESPAFRAGNGFITGNDSRGASGWIGYKYPMEKPLAWLPVITEVDGTVTAVELWNYDATSKLRSIQPRLDLSLIGQSDLHFSYRRYQERFSSVSFPNLHQWEVFGSTKFSKVLAFGADVTIGRIIARNAEPIATGNEVDLNVWCHLKPFDGFLIEPTYIYSELTADDGSRFYSGSIYLSYFTYQLNRNLDIRLIMQYDGFQQQLLADPLIRYRINPFTSFYLGSTHNFEQLNGGTTLRPTDRQFFAKVQYLIQA